MEKIKGQNDTLEQTKIAAEDKQDTVPEADIDVSKSGRAAETPLREENMSKDNVQKEETVPILQYRELQSAFTKKSQLVKEYEAKINAAPSREDIIRDYLLSVSSGQRPNVMTSSSSNYDFAKEKKPVTLNEAERLARVYFMNGID